MKNIYKAYYKILICLSILVFGSCSNEFLEIVPKGQLIGEKVVDYDKLFYNLNLVNLRSANGQAYLGAESTAFEPFFGNTELRRQRFFKWEANVYDNDENMGELEVPMENLYIYNKIINEILIATDGTEEQKRVLQAEAKAGRAWVYFLMVNYFGMPYNDQTSSTDLGFPIVTVADLAATDFKRATVQENYDLIIKDLTEAIPDLPTGIDSRFRFTRAAAKGLLGKVYTFMGKFAEARPLLDEALVEQYNIGIEVGLIDYNEQYERPNAQLDPQNLYGKQIVIAAIANRQYELVVKPEVMALYNENDLRFQLLYTPSLQSGDPIPIDGAYKKNVGTSQSQIGVRVPELYLLSAEVKCRLNDLSGAVDDVEFLRERRLMPGFSEVPAEIASDREALLRFIFDERLREFALEGYHWFDMRRLTVDPDLATPVSSYTHKIYNADGSLQDEYQLTQERLVIKFSPTVMDQNPNLINND